MNQLLEDVRHTLVSLEGLYAFDGECPSESWRLEFSDLINRLDEEL